MIIDIITWLFGGDINNLYNFFISLFFCMKKNYLYTALWLMGIMGTLSMWVVSADTSCWNTYWWTVPTTTYASGITYGCDGNIPVITIESNWKWITIKAMNEWSVKIWLWNDESSYWSLYQWWNNHPFPNVKGWSISATSSSPVSAASYWPTNYYSGAKWITQSQWDSSDNRNLWWWSWDEKSLNWMWWFDTTNFVVINSWARKAMCPEWYHIPSAWEWNALMYLWTSNSNYTTTNLNTLSSNSETSIWTNFGKDMMIPFVGTRSFNSTAYAGTYGNYWSSSPDDNANNARNFSLDADSLYADYDSYRANGYSVRCFKNSYIKPPQSFTLTFDADANGWITTTWSVEVDGSVDLSWYVATKTGWDFLWWNTNSWATAPISTSYNAYTITENTTVYAIFKKNLKVTYLSWVWVASIWADSGSCAIYNTGTQCTVTAPDINLKDWYGTWIWSTWSVNVNTWADITLIADDTYTASATPNTYIVKFDAWEWAWTMEDQTFTYDVAQNLTWNKFTKDWYTFSGWTDWITTYTDKQNVLNLATSWTITLTAQWKQNTPSWGSSTGWGSSWWWSRRATTTDDSKLTPWTTANNDTSKDNSSVDSQNNNTQWKIYSEEFQKAYEFAYKNWITTMDTIEKAEMDKPLTRIAMAKMLSYYAINVLWKKPANIVVPKFSDVTDKMDEEYDNGVTLAYQLWIMWINMPNNKFRPNDLVTRAEFATALSRLLFDTPDGKDKYYSTHLAKLMEEKIITNDNPNLQELRWYVMIMLMRSSENK